MKMKTAKQFAEGLSLILFGLNDWVWPIWSHSEEQMRTKPIGDGFDEIINY